jgi:putative nucleotidyltransferase with HDIG domain
VLHALERLRQGGGAAVLVGGTVRDALLGRELQAPADVATSVPPDEVMRRFARVEPIGLAHGTVLVLEGDVAIECTTFRREGAYADARHPDHVEYTTRLEDDLARRDFTINALAFDPSTGVLTDPHDGCLDLERGVLRAVGDPVQRFHEDALRPLRAARLAATLQLDVAPETAAALGSARDRAALVAMERVREEWSKLLGAPAPSIGLEHLRRAGLLELWAPEVARGYGVLQNEWHAWDVYEHSLRVCDAAPADKPRVRWAALLHDIGKPDTRVIRDGHATFYGHAEVGATLADRLLERFRMAERRARRDRAPRPRAHVRLPARMVRRGAAPLAASRRARRRRGSVRPAHRRCARHRAASAAAFRRSSRSCASASTG